MILEYSNTKFNTKTKVLLKCDKCGSHQYRPYLKYLELTKYNKLFDMDYCQPCWGAIRQSSPEARKKMSISINKMIAKDPQWKVRNSESKKGINIGDKNGMKQEAARKKVSESRINKFKDPLERRKVSEKLIKAWADGKYEGVKVGICKWFDYKHSNGNSYKVQGTWELAFIEWLDKSKLEFTCHRGRLPYISEGIQRNYYPDFYVTEWNCYVDIKNKYHHSIQKDKFTHIREAGHSVRLIFKEELQKLIGKKL